MPWFTNELSVYDTTLTNDILFYIRTNRNDIMARGTRSRKNFHSPKVIKKTRAQTLNSKPKSPRSRSQKNVANSQKVTADTRTSTQKKTPPIRSTSPSIFSVDLFPVYQGLEYTQNSNSEPLKNTSNVIANNRKESSDMFPTEPTESPTPVQMVSVGVQYSPVQRRDIGVGTEVSKFRDFGVQTSPLPISCQIIYETDESGDGFDSFSDHSDSDCRGSSSSDPLHDFDMLEDLDDNNQKLCTKADNQTENTIYDEDKSNVSSSPIAHKIYVNETFHSPNSLRIHLNANNNNTKKSNDLPKWNQWKTCFLFFLFLQIVFYFLNFVSNKCFFLLVCSNK